VGKGRALELMMTADMISAADAHAMGLVNHVVEAAELLNKTKEILKKIHTKAPLAIAGVIKCANAALDNDTDGFALEIDTFSSCFATKDLEEGAAAFLQKRKANFTGE
jgi:enoyl-CoA hydratase